MLCLHPYFFAKMPEPRVSEVSEDLQCQGNHWGTVSLSGPHRGSTVLRKSVLTSNSKVSQLPLHIHLSLPLYTKQFFKIIFLFKIVNVLDIIRCSETGRLGRYILKHTGDSFVVIPQDMLNNTLYNNGYLSLCRRECN